MARDKAVRERDYDEQAVEGGVPLKMWTRGVPVEDAARQQLANAAKLPIVFRHVAAMPDVHVGIGATVGSVIPTKGAVIPAAVGVDIGCGMMAARTSLVASDLPDTLEQIRSAIEQLFGVKVTGVWTSNQRGKEKRMGKTVGRRPNWKKAIVTLREGDTIEIFEG